MPGQNEPAGAGLGVYSMDRMVGDGGPFPHATPSGPYFDPEFSRTQHHNHNLAAIDTFCEGVNEILKDLL